MLQLVDVSKGKWISDVVVCLWQSACVTSVVHVSRRQDVEQLCADNARTRARGGGARWAGAAAGRCDDSADHGVVSGVDGIGFANVTLLHPARSLLK